MCGNQKWKDWLGTCNSKTLEFVSQLKTFLYNVILRKKLESSGYTDYRWGNDVSAPQPQSGVTYSIPLF